MDRVASNHRPSNVFVLSTGRWGSVTFARACAHITNFTAGHESRSRLVGPGRLDYPYQHIEADNRLSWILGRLDDRYGKDAFYVHLTRDEQATARSFHRRWKAPKSIIHAYSYGILMNGEESIEVASDYVQTVNANIRAFLKDKPRRMDFRLENAHQDFRGFWDAVGAEGDLDAALAEWNVPHNASTGRDGGRRRWYAPWAKA